ncbi:F-box/LRR-repeat protein 7-like [Bufo bufo]|uniref:F-box/LRR-repeat protein 7-like n=1 Tax=Bufo bufo TaxID=8384 RepID=UPI001ABE3228|nr:F-box/LRR-repeat protein 7-like [Bufo bufo]
MNNPEDPERNLGLGDVRQSRWRRALCDQMDEADQTGKVYEFRQYVLIMTTMVGLHHTMLQLSFLTVGCSFSEGVLIMVLMIKILIKLEIFGCHTLTAKCLTSVATECVHLENLNIGRIPKATDLCLAKIASHLHKITTLNLTGLNVVRDRAVHHIVKQCSKLENLSLSTCLQVTDVSLVEISTYRTTIKYLDLSGCKKVSDIGIQALARSCLQLRYLDLSSTNTGKRGVCLLASYCYATLECLKLSFCKEVPADAIEKLCMNCKRLKVLHLYGCRVSPDLGYLKKFSKSFQILHDLSIPAANILGE